MSLVLTAMAEAAIRARSLFEQFEGRFSIYGGLKPYMDGANALLPKDSLERLKSQQNARSVVFPILTKQTLSVITARSCVIAGTSAVSAKPTISKITKGFEIAIYPKVNDNNYISETDEFANQLTNGLRSVLPALDTYAAGQLEAGKNTALATTNLPGVAIVGNAYQIDNAHRDRLYFYLRTLMEKNDIGSSVLANIGSTESLDLLLQYESKGTYNDQNLAGVLNGDVPSAISNFRNYRSNRITNGTGVAETHYIVPFGMIGVFMWNDSDAVNKRGGPNGAKAYTFNDGVIGITWDVYEEPICSDLTATYGAGYERTLGTRYQFAADFGFYSAYSSDTTKPIVKVEVTTA
jgi:hypothetical protein